VSFKRVRTNLFLLLQPNHCFKWETDGRFFRDFAWHSSMLWSHRRSTVPARTSQRGLTRSYASSSFVLIALEKKRERCWLLLTSRQFSPRLSQRSPTLTHTRRWIRFRWPLPTDDIGERSVLSITNDLNWVWVNLPWWINYSCIGHKDGREWGPKLGMDFLERGVFHH